MDRSAGTGGGGRWEGAMSRLTVDPRPEKRGRVGCKRLVKISRTVADRGAEGCRTWGGGRMIHKTVDNGGAGTRLGCNNSDRA